ncbi:putative ATPase [Aquimarina sp. MAR_2010_214]|uniref:AAA family ATPase n=1 Tax=Aquimarina sp. MAR_2010_214 TaxID=1250026 RepID=UPI000CBF7B8B|nr:AAA family ATPase [Aquimarina sp. MAR_2010_214]PKV52557.1 putative ATPase [Aquimarina sp. MAR_2010_214]
MINKISFKNYKSFKDEQIIEIKPLTVIIGKNSSGKSAIVKLPTLIEGSLSGNFEDPILTVNNGVELGAEFRDLIYGREVGTLNLILEQDANKLSIEIASGLKESDLPKIRKWNFNNEVDLIYMGIENTYYDNISKAKMNINFNGFGINSIENSTKSDLKGRKFTLNTNYIGPFRDVPNRTYSSRGNTKSSKNGIRGELTYQLLLRDYLYNESKLINQVNDWYKKNFDGWGLQINSISKPDYKIELTRSNPEFSINLRDVGEGMSQVLPLVVSAFMENDNEVLTILEQPELHLHPAAHGNLAELFAESAKKNKFLIETHSNNFVLRLRRLIAQGDLDNNDVALYSVEYNVENNTSSLKKIDILANGDVSYWPTNVFSEALDETIAIRTAQLDQK